MVKLEEAVAGYTARERAWLAHDHRGRWVVIEPGIGHLLSGCSKAARRYADATSRRRARRFSSLSRARAFARSVGGIVARWRRTPPRGGAWTHESPWQRALSTNYLRVRLASTLASTAGVVRAAEASIATTMHLVDH